jgi:hypothetical protein
VLFYSKGKVGTLYITIETFSKSEREEEAKTTTKKRNKRRKGMWVEGVKVNENWTLW